MSDFRECDQPSNAAKLSSASGKTSFLSLKNEMSMSTLRLLSFCPLFSVRRGTCPKAGGSHPNALYNATCKGVEDIHSCNIESLINIY